jgi:hypothetical protein
VSDGARESGREEAKWASADVPAKRRAQTPRAGDTAHVGGR